MWSIIALTYSPQEEGRMEKITFSNLVISGFNVVLSIPVTVNTLVSNGESVRPGRAEIMTEGN